MRFEKLQMMPWYYRLAAFCGVALVAYTLFWYFVTSSTRAETKALNDQVATLLTQNAQAQIASQRLNNFRAEYKNKQEELEDLKVLLPDQRELTNILQGIQDRAKKCNLVLRRFTPKDDVQQDFYSGKPVEVEVSSTFANLRAFFDQMGKYQRIVSISDFKITRLDDKQYPEMTVDAQFMLTAYYVSAEKLQNAQPQQAQQKPAAPPAAAPPAKQ